MEDLLQSQIQESCKLALPNGLKELMSDISREVLRAQPKNLCNFIADYLSVLLVSRENLTVAAKVCGGICLCIYRELEGELRDIGIDEEDLAKAKDIIVDYIKNGGSQEANVILNLVNNTEIKEDQLEAVKGAIQRAYKNHQVNHNTIFELSDSEEDDVKRAVKHTLNIYGQSNVSREEYCRAEERVKGAYQAYGVRRPKEEPELSEASILTEKTEKSRSIRFGTNKGKPSTSFKRTSSLSGSLIKVTDSRQHLPRNLPFSVQEPSILEYIPETDKDRIIINYINKTETTSEEASVEDETLDGRVSDILYVCDEEELKDPERVKKAYTDEIEENIEMENELSENDYELDEFEQFEEYENY